MQKGHFEGQERSIVKYRDTADVYAKTAETIEEPFGLRTRVDLGNYVLDGGPDSPMGRRNFGRKKTSPLPYFFLGTYTSDPHKLLYYL